MHWPEIYFARHGETSWNRERRYQGSKDIPLNELGQRQADANGVLLKDLLKRHGRDPKEFYWVYSPLSRAAETMERMRAAFDPDTLPKANPDARLREISFGVLEGRLHHELPPELAVAPGEREGDYWFHRPPEGESYEDVAERLISLFETIDQPSIVVAHGGVLRVLRRLIENVGQKEAVNWFPPQGVIAQFRNGEMTLFRTALASG